MNTINLSPKTARQIINQLGGSGQPPEYGSHLFTVGLDDYLHTINKYHLEKYIQDGGSAFKMVVGVYGGGKTHFLYNVQDLAWKNNFVVSYVSLRSSGECPFYQLDLVYKAIINGIIPPLDSEELSQGVKKGIGAFLKAWYADQYQQYKNDGLDKTEIQNEFYQWEKAIRDIDSNSFANAIRKAIEFLRKNQDSSFETICQWLTGEGYDRNFHQGLGIYEKIDKTTAFKMIRSLGQTVRLLGYNGLVILFDEAERIVSLSKKNKEQHLSNLRELIDECGKSQFQGIMLFYAVPDLNFLEGGSGIYEALKQRIRTVFNTVNYHGVRIELEKTIQEPIDFLMSVGNKLLPVYELAYSYNFDVDKAQNIIEIVAEWAVEQQFGDEGYKRLFVQNLIKGFDLLRLKNEIIDEEQLG